MTPCRLELDEDGSVTREVALASYKVITLTGVNMVGSDDRALYQGENFTGHSTQKSLPPAQESQQTPGKDEVNESQDQHPAIRCPNCNITARKVTGGRLWCPRCRQVVGSQVVGSRSQGAPILGLLVIVLFIAALFLAGGFYATGTFDHNLNSFGLNWEPCAVRWHDGKTICGEELSAGASAHNGLREKLESLF